VEGPIDERTRRNETREARMKGKSKWKVGLVVLFLGLLAFLAPTFLRTGEAGLPPLNTVTADRGNVAQRIVAHGTLQPVQTVTVGSQVSGIIEEIRVDFNSPVRRGEVIARIDPSTFEAAVRSAEAELEAAEASLELARLQWRRVQTLREARVVPVSEVEQANANLRQAEADLTVRRHALERAQRELDRCTIYAPTDGIVISRNVDVGQTVAASLSAPELFEIATDLSAMRIHAMVTEADIGAVREGQLVRFTVDAHRGRELTGEVVQVRNAPIMESNVVHYETIIAVDNREGLLKPGMTAEVAVITAEVEGAVRVRNTALRARLPDQLLPPGGEAPEAEGRHVFRVRNGAIERVAVRTGLSDELHTEILEGLEPGDVLAVGLSLQAGEEGGRRSLFQGSQARF
jgi:HlyD family secretion protein